MSSVETTWWNGIKGSAARIGYGIGLVAGVASFFYALSADDRQRWVWIFAALALAIVLLPFGFHIGREVTSRYLRYPQLVKLAAGAKDEKCRREREIDKLREELSNAFASGIEEGIGRITAAAIASDVFLVPRNFDVQGERVGITARVSIGGAAEEGARYTLIFRDTGQGLCILAVTTGGMTPVLHPIALAADSAWLGVISKVATGDKVPDDFQLEPATIEHYEAFGRPPYASDDLGAST